MSTIELLTAYVSLVPTMQGVQGKAAEALAPMVGEAQQVGAAAGGALTAGVSGIAAKAALGAAAVGAVAAGAGKALYGVGQVFDDVADTIRVGTGASGAALDSLVISAKRVGTRVPADYAQIGPVVADLNTRLGLSGETLETVSAQYLEAGRILGQDIDIQKTTAAFSAFGIEGAAVEGAMDSLFRVSQATGVGMNQLAATTQSAAPAMKALGFSFEETAALAGTLDKAGLNSQQVMNGLSRGLVNLAKTGEEPQEAFRRVTGEIQAFAAEGDTAAAMNLASKIFGTRGAPQFVEALQAGKINLHDITGAAGLTGDTILGLGQETADAGEKWQLLKNRALAALEPLGSAVFSLAASGLGGLVTALDWVQGAVNRIDFGPMIGGLASVGGPVMDAFRQAFTSLAPVFSQLLPIIMQLWQNLSPMSLLFQALVPIVPIIADAVSQLVAGMTPLVQLVAGVGQELLAALIPAFSAVMQAITPLIPALLSIATALLPPLMSAFGAIVPVLVQVVQSAITPLAQILSSVLVPVIQALMPVVTTVFGSISAVISSVMQVIQGVIQVVTGVISGNWSQVWTGVHNIFGGIWDTIVNLVRGAINIVSSIISSVIGGIGSFIGGALGNIGRFFSDTWGGIVRGTQDMIGGLIGFFTSLPGKIMGVLSGAGQWLVGIGRNMVQGLLDGIGAMAGSIGRFFLNLLPDWIVGPFKAALGIASPSKVFRGFGVNIGQGVILGLDDIAPSIDHRMASLVSIPASPGAGRASPTTQGEAAEPSQGVRMVNYFYGTPATMADELERRQRYAMVGV